MPIGQHGGLWTLVSLQPHSRIPLPAPPLDPNEPNLLLSVTGPAPVGTTLCLIMGHVGIPVKGEKSVRRRFILGRKPRRRSRFGREGRVASISGQRGITPAHRRRKNVDNDRDLYGTAVRPHGLKLASQ
jgi:hypothetical protein